MFFLGDHNFLFELRYMVGIVIRNAEYWRVAAGFSVTASYSFWGNIGFLGSGEGETFVAMHGATISRNQLHMHEGGSKIMTI